MPITGARRIESDEFGISVTFRSGAEAPSRVFQAIADLIKGFQAIDGFLLASSFSELRPSLLLEDIEEGSIRVWLRNAVVGVDDEALKSGEVKKIVGTCLVRAKYAFVDWVDRTTKITGIPNVEELQLQILETLALARPHLLPVPGRLPVADVVTSVKLLGSAVEELSSGQHATYVTSTDEVTLASFAGAPEKFADLLIARRIDSKAEMILVVKKPDFLGNSRWEFKHGKESFEARIGHVEWLQRYHDGEIVLVPGDALRVMVHSVASYAADGELVDISHSIQVVEEVIRMDRCDFQRSLIPPMDRQ